MLVKAEKKDGKFINLPPHFAGAKMPIPPAWKNVMVETDPSKRVWVVAKDKVGRTVRLYSPSWKEKTKNAKFNRVKLLLEEWHEIEKQIKEALYNKSARFATKEAATIAYLIFNTGIRPGSDAEVALVTKIKAYGATTLEARHIHPVSRGIRLKFIGKKGVKQSVLVTDSYLVKVLMEKKRTCSPRTRIWRITDGELRRFFTTLGSGIYTPKDFRTALGTKMAISLLERKRYPKTKKDCKRIVRNALDKVSKALGNTRAVCKSAYVDPEVLKPWMAKLEERREKK